MSEQVVFFLEAGNLALDLLNTREDPDGLVADRLRSPDGVRAWLDAVGLTESDTTLRSPPAARVLLTEARGLRDDVLHAVQALLRHEAVPGHAVYGINRVLEAGSATAFLRLDAEGARLEARERVSSPLAILVPVARAAADLIVEGDPDRIRRCASEACGRWFVDTSKGGRRKWCSMATCGNRAKAATHRRRQATA